MREKRKIKNSEMSKDTSLDDEKKKYEEIMARLDKYKDQDESITDRVAIQGELASGYKR